MKVILGLGNIGETYLRTRHNAGFMVADAYADSCHIQLKNDKKIYGEWGKNAEKAVIKPSTYMNESGKCVRAYYDYYGAGFNPDLGKNLWVIHDDLDLELGTYKIQFGTGPKVHNGLLSVYDHLGTHDFWHVRIGIENRGAVRAQWPAHEYVLDAFTDAETKILESVITEVITRLM